LDDAMEISTVICDDGTTFYASHAVVITVSLGVLQSPLISFTPLLPEQKINVIKRMGMGHYHKTIISFNRSFWENSNTSALKNCAFSVGGISDNRRWLTWFNPEPYLSKPILIAVNIGANAIELESMPIEKVKSDAIAQILGILGLDSLPPDVSVVDFAVTNWGTNIFTQGSYSFNTVGSVPDDCNVLAEPSFGKWFFAGEATSYKYPGYVHGAYYEGVRAAREILETKVKATTSSTPLSSTFNPL